jgi:hypothetical protein
VTLVHVDVVLIKSLAPVLRDVLRTDLPMTFELAEYDWDESVSWIATGMLRMSWRHEQSGTAVQVSKQDPESDRIAHLADIVQDLVIEETLLPWPRCPRHPDGGHPLLAVPTGDAAMWNCPADHVPVADVGHLSA